MSLAPVATGQLLNSATLHIERSPRAEEIRPSKFVSRVMDGTLDLAAQGTATVPTMKIEVVDTHWSTRDSHF